MLIWAFRNTVKETNDIFIREVFEKKCKMTSYKNLKYLREMKTPMATNGFQIQESL